MSEPFVFDPRCELCKTPFGAAVCGQEILFTCRPLASEGFTHCALVLHREFAGQSQELELSPAGFLGDRVCFSTAFTAPEEPELIWYHFRFWRDDGSGCDLDRTGYRSDGQPLSWQLTVYRRSAVPDWYGEGMVYQIFPDRFRRLTVPDPRGLVGDRWVHQDWDEDPVWRPDPDGEVRNRDFFGGSLEGITSQLDELAELGVTALYLCPIFESASNHRYNTADYTKIDPLLGNEEDFKTLCAQAKERGIRVILDGVFNHTGSQSIYFNADGFYPSLGAAQSQDSPYSDWFSFHPWPHDYDAWWGIRTLPAVREDAASYVDYIIDGENSIIRRWLKAGASGWRLDVADELPGWFIEKARKAVEETKSDGLLIGEVWEDASNKIAYSQRRKYLLGSELHGVMNYPFRTALLTYLKGGDASGFRDAMETIRENYPQEAFYANMNFLGTHDTARILTVLGADEPPASKEERASFRLSPDQRERGVTLLRLAALALFSFPGVPTVFYGDEAGMEGWEDPFNRGTYPWSREDTAIRDYFTRLSGLRKQRSSLRRGGIRWLAAQGRLAAYIRESAGERSVTVLNAGDTEQPFEMDWPWETCTDLLSGRKLTPVDGRLALKLGPYEGLLLG